MLWHPPLNATTMAVLVLVALAAAAASYLIARRQLDPRTPQGMLSIGLRALGFLLLLLLVLQPARLPEPETRTVRRTFATLIDSSASMSLTNRDGTVRLDELRQRLTNQRFAQIVGEPAQLAFYTFGNQFEPIESDALSELEADGSATDIAAALQAVVRQHRHDDLAGILILSDGRVTQGEDPRALVRSEDVNVPIYTLLVGEAVTDDEDDADARRPDLAVESVTAPPRLVLGRSATIVTSVSARDFPARQITVELVANDQVISTSAVAVSPQQQRRQALFSIEPSEMGEHTYQVRIAVEEQEVDPTNNARSFTIDVVDPVNRLLYIDRLRQERRFLNRVIESQRYAREESADLSAEQLRGLKAVILGDLPAAALEADQIEALAEWVDAGGSLLLLAGPESLGDEGFASTPLARLLPVRTAASGAQYIEEEYRVQLTPDGAAHPAFQRVSQQRWAEAPTLLSRLRIAEVKPAATVLFATAGSQSAPDAADKPVVVSHAYGHGKVAVVLTDSTWRWQLGFAPGAQRRTSEHALFWQQMIDWMMPELEQDDTGGGQVQLITDRLEYELGDQVVMLAAVRDVDGTFMDNAQVSFTIGAPDGRPLAREGTLDDATGESDAFTATFEARIEGEYTIQATAQVNGRTIGTDRAQVRVHQPQLEFAQPDPDHALLRELARLSGGEALQPQQLADLVSLARLSPREIEVQPSADADAEPIWNRWWMLIAFLAVMSGEWFVRRRNQWV